MVSREWSKVPSLPDVGNALKNSSSGEMGAECRVSLGITALVIYLFIYLIKLKNFVKK